MSTDEAFVNLAQATAEDRASVTNPTDANIQLATQVEEQSNHMATKDANM